jgi:hypothetical protein
MHLIFFFANLNSEFQVRQELMFMKIAGQRFQASIPHMNLSFSHILRFVTYIYG